jgi:hypothetical protein
MKRKLFAIIHVCKYFRKIFLVKSISFVSFCNICPFFVLRVSYFSSSHSSSQLLLLNLTNNLILYQTIFDSILSKKNNKKIFKPINKTKYQLSTNEYKIKKTFSQHGLLIDKYLDARTMDDNSMDDSFPWKDFLGVLFLIFFICLICYYRDCLLKSFRERHKRSVLKYSV